jgi:hypothetical protein
MCYWYSHIYSCKHTTYALGKYCSAAGLVQTPCKKKSIWQTIRMGEECEQCAMPAGRVGNAVDVGARGGAGDGDAALTKQEREREKERRKSGPAGGTTKPRKGKR